MRAAATHPHATEGYPLCLETSSLHQLNAAAAAIQGAMVKLDGFLVPGMLLTLVDLSDKAIVCVRVSESSKYRYMLSMCLQKTLYTLTAID